MKMQGQALLRGGPALAVCSKQAQNKNDKISQFFTKKRQFLTVEKKRREEEV